jgi:thermolysin
MVKEKQRFTMLDVKIRIKVFALMMASLAALAACGSSSQQSYEIPNDDDSRLQGTPQGASGRAEPAVLTIRDSAGHSVVINVTRTDEGYYLYDQTRNIYTYDAGGGTDYISLGYGSVYKNLGFDASGEFATPHLQVMAELHYNLARTYDYYKKVWGRDSWDNKGRRVIAAAHFGQNSDNASWTGSKMVFSDGRPDDPNSVPLGRALDVVAHEFTHGVTTSAANLLYRQDPGALSEAYSDIFGTLVKFHYQGKSTGWEFGTDAVGGESGVRALRSLEKPSRYEQPEDLCAANKKGLQNTNIDQGGVHYRAAVINHFAYLLAEGGEVLAAASCLESALNSGASLKEIRIKPIGSDALGRLLYTTLIDGLDAQVSFFGFRRAVERTAGRLIARGELPADALSSVQSAFEAVGINDANEKLYPGTSSRPPQEETTRGPIDFF